MEKVRTSELRGWRKSMLVNEIEEHINTHTMNGVPLTEKEKEAYRWGFTRGWSECSSCLSFHGRMKLQID